MWIECWSKEGRSVDASSLQRISLSKTLRVFITKFTLCATATMRTSATAVQARFDSCCDYHGVLCTAGCQRTREQESPQLAAVGSIHRRARPSCGHYTYIMHINTNQKILSFWNFVFIRKKFAESTPIDESHLLSSIQIGTLQGSSFRITWKMTPFTHHHHYVYQIRNDV